MITKLKFDLSTFTFTYSAGVDLVQREKSVIVAIEQRNPKKINVKKIRTKSIHLNFGPPEKRSYNGLYWQWRWARATKIRKINHYVCIETKINKSSSAARRNNRLCFNLIFSFFLSFFSTACWLSKQSKLLCNVEAKPLQTKRNEITRIGTHSHTNTGRCVQSKAFISVAI